MLFTKIRNKWLTIVMGLIIPFTAFSYDIPNSAYAVESLKKGDLVPNSKVFAPSSGTPKSLKKLLLGKNTVLIFYRGGWCHYCQRHLKDIQSVQSSIASLGYQIIGISPDSPNYINKTISKKALNYKLFSDPYLNTAEKFKIVYRDNEKQNLKAEYSEGTNTELLPVPSLFLVDKKGVIKFSYSNPDFKIRITSSALINIIKSYK